MNQEGKLSHVTKEYLIEFECILNNMISRMTSAELTDSISYNFIVQMIPHHEAAIHMSRNLLKYTTCIPLQDIAERIVTEQTKSIENMLAIKCACERRKNSSHELCLYQRRMNEIMKVMFNDMKKACSDNCLNNDFMWEMIPHHRGAVEMSETTLQFSICPELRPILQAIIVSQKRGIRQMQELLRG